MKKISIWIRHENDRQQGKDANLEDLHNYFKEKGKISEGYKIIEESHIFLENFLATYPNEKCKLFLDVIQGNKVIKSMELNLDVFREKKRRWF